MPSLYFIMDYGGVNLYNDTESKLHLQYCVVGYSRIQYNRYVEVENVLKRCTKTASCISRKLLDCHLNLAK